MKTVIEIFFLTLILIDVTYSQWQADVRLTNDPALSSTNQYTNGRCIASSGDTVHVVWYDTRNGASPEIYYKRSVDGGANWGADTRITNNIYFSTNPSVAVSGSIVHIVWEDDRDGTPGVYEIYYKHSTDGGATWGTETRLTNDPAMSQNACVSASGSYVNVVWSDFRNGAQAEIYYKRSSDGGISWGADTRLTNDPAGSWWPSVSASGSVVHALWMDGRNGHQDIYYKRSTDAGVNWGADMPLTNDTNHRYTPSMSVSGSNVHILFLDSRDWDPGPYEIYYKHSTDGGISWSADTRLTIHYTSASLHSVIAASGNNVHVVWDDNRNSAANYEIYYKGSTNGGINWGADTRLTYDSSLSMYPFVSASGTTVNCVWMDNRNGNFEIYHKRDPAGNPASTFQSQFNRNILNKPITDNQNTFDTIAVDYSAYANYFVYDVNLKIDTVIHAKDSDLEYYLIHNGVTDTTIYQVGGTGQNFINTVLNDSASTLIGNGSAPFTGAFKPNGLLSQFNGQTINGAWILKIYDRAAGNTGVLKAWSLNFLISANPLAVQNISGEVPNDFRLIQNYPNPFNPATNIKFSLPKSSFVKLVVYDITGREVETLVNENLYAGSFNVNWNAANYSSGVYFYKLTVRQAGSSTEDFSETKKMILVK